MVRFPANHLELAILGHQLKLARLLVVGLSIARAPRAEMIWLRCGSFAANVGRLQLHSLAYNPGDFLRTLATPEPIQDWSMTTLRSSDRSRVPSRIRDV